MANESSTVNTVRSMIAGFQQTYNNDADLANYMSIFAPDVAWFDHAFHICRVGRPAVAGLRTGFLHINQPFDTKIKSIEPTKYGAVAEMIWTGRTVNDIVRPDGQVAIKATGKDFECHVCMTFRVNDEGKIARIDEYYAKQWDDGIAEEQYHVMKGASLKAL